MLANRFIIGFLLIGIGGLFLASQLGYVSIDIGEVVGTYWPVALILIGLLGMVGRSGHEEKGRNFVWNAILMLIGAVFLLNNLDLVKMSVGEMFRLLIPVLIILFGIRTMLKPAREKRAKDYSYKYEYKYEYNPGSAADTPGNGTDTASFPGGIGDIPPPPGHDEAGAPPPRTSKHAENRSGFFGDLYLGQDDWELQPMNVSHFIGDTIIDLTKARIPEGETRLAISSFIGDVKVFAPNHIDVEFSVNSSSFIGDIVIFNRRESGFMRSVNEEPSTYSSADRRIRLQISLFIGDVNVQRVG